MIKYKDILELNNNNDDNILLVNATTNKIIGTTTSMNNIFNYMYLECEVKHIGYSNDINPCNLLILIEI